MSYNESLRVNSNYPLMSQSDWDNAPWNDDKENEPIEKDCTFLCSMQKSSSVETTDYTSGFVDKEWDGDGWVAIHEDDDFSSTDWMNAWDECHETPISLIKQLKEIAQCCLEGKTPTKTKSQWQYLFNECIGWEQMDEEIDY